jgi:hypothetical protein
MEAAGVPKRVYRDSGSDVTSVSQRAPPVLAHLILSNLRLMVAWIITASNRWTVAQILTPILVAFFLCLAFILYFLYRRGSLSLLSMRGVRRVRRHREWEVDGGSSDSPHAPDAEATPMISQPHHWNSFFPRNTTDRQRLSSRIREGMATPSITTAIRSIRRLFGRGPVPVSRVPMPDTFDLESSDSETDPFDTLRSNASRAKLRPFAKQTAASGSDRGESSYTFTHHSGETRESQALDAELDDSDQTLDQGVVNGVGGGNGADDHDNTGDCVMLITRNGEDFSSGSTSISLRSRPAEADQSSIEVVPPTPTVVSTSYNAMICTFWLTVTTSAFPRGRLPLEKCVHTSSSLPLRLSPTTLVLPVNRRPVKPPNTSIAVPISFAPHWQGRHSC